MFFADQEIPGEALAEAMRTLVPVSGVKFSPDIMEENADANDPGTLYIRLQIFGGTFTHHYEVQSFLSHRRLLKREIVEMLRRVATSQKANILLYEDDVDPYLFIQMEPAGYASCVGVDPPSYDDRDELIVDCYYNLAFGSFALKVPMDDETAILKSVLSGVVDEYRLSYIDERTDPKTSFAQYKSSFANLRDFCHFYFIMPEGRFEWLSADEKSARFEDIMRSFHSKTGLDVCFFPANGTNIQNIPGGSDSESFCILLSKGDAEKIIYKPRRKSWI